MDAEVMSLLVFAALLAVILLNMVWRPDEDQTYLVTGALVGILASLSGALHHAGWTALSVLTAFLAAALVPCVLYRAFKDARDA